MVSSIAMSGMQHPSDPKAESNDEGQIDNGGNEGVASLVATQWLVRYEDLQQQPKRVQLQRP
jgi:hypothetical protein